MYAVASPSGEHVCLLREERRYLRYLMNGLTNYERRFLKMRYGLGCEPHTFAEIARQHCMHRWRATAIVHRAIHKIRKAMLTMDRSLKCST